MKIIRASLMCLLGAAVLSSCVKQAFDNPPNTSSIDPNLPVNATLGQLSVMGLGILPGSAIILGDTTVVGVVVGDDRSGNIYKQLIIEDTAGGGITILLDKTNLYGDYPVGRKVYIKTKGLYLTSYNGLPELAYAVGATGTTSGIPSALIGNYVIKGSFPNYITPKTMTIDELSSNTYAYLNTLVTIVHMQFDDASAAVPYSNASSSTNRTIKACGSTSTITMYNSSYSTFQSYLTPTGNGSITGLVSIYHSTPQFTLRDTTDVKFTDARCE